MPQPDQKSNNRFILGVALGCGGTVALGILAVIGAIIFGVFTSKPDSPAQATPPAADPARALTPATEHLDARETALRRPAQPPASAQSSGDPELDSARQVAENFVASQLSQLDKVEILGSVAHALSRDDKMDALRVSDWGVSQSDVVVLVQFRLGGMRDYATVGCIRTPTPGTWNVSIIRTTAGQ